MMKIVLFALVSVASFSQVYGASLEEEIKEAIKTIDFVNKFVTGSVETVEHSYNYTQREIRSRSSKNIDLLNKFTNQAVNELKEASKALKAVANQNKLPESVIKCISKEEESAISTVKVICTKYGEDVKKMSAGKLNTLASLEKGVIMLNQTRAETHKKAVDEIKNCKDVESVKKTVQKYDDEYVKIFERAHEFNQIMDEIYFTFDRDITALNTSAYTTIHLNKANGVRKMKQCLKG